MALNDNRTNLMIALTAMGVGGAAGSLMLMSGDSDAHHPTLDSDLVHESSSPSDDPVSDEPQVPANEDYSVPEAAEDELDAEEVLPDSATEPESFPLPSPEPVPTSSGTKRPADHHILRLGYDEPLFAENDEAPKYTSDGKFNLFVSRCALSFFPGAHMPMLEDIESEHLDAKSFTPRDVTPHREINYPWGPSRGCAIMSVQRRGHLFLFKSEVTLKNDKVGFAFWTGVKHVRNDKKSGLLNLKFTHYLVIFGRHRKSDKWAVQAGYGWGTEQLFQVAHVKRLIIAFPNGRREHILNLHSVDLTTTVNGYSGVWEENSNPRGVPALSLSSTPYHVGLNRALTHQTLILDPTKINGYNMNGQNVQTFFHRPIIEDGKWSWKRLIRGIETTRIDVVPTIEDWYRPFRLTKRTLLGRSYFVPRTGIWTEMNTYCNRLQEKDITKEQMRENPCFVGS